jgi:hypothetical protein
MASVLMEKSETITLDLCTSILPVAADLLESKTDRYFDAAFVSDYDVFWDYISSSLSGRDFD